MNLMFALSGILCLASGISPAGDTTWVRGVQVALQRGPIHLPALNAALASASPRSGNGSGGTLVTIRGSGFLAGVRVYFGHQSTGIWLEAPLVKVFNSNTIQAMTPAWPMGSATQVTVDIKAVNPKLSLVLPTLSSLERDTSCPEMKEEKWATPEPRDLSSADLSLPLPGKSGDQSSAGR